MPFCEMRLGGRPAMSSPSNTIRPLVGRSTPVRQLKNVLLPAPFGPMMARISPGRTSKLTALSAVKPPKRTVRASVRMIGSSAPPRSIAGSAATAAPARLGELARRWEDRLLLGNDVKDAVFAVFDIKDEFPDERLVVLLANHLVALREIVAFLHFQTFEGLDQLHGVLPALELGFFHAELEGIHGLEVRLHVAIGQRTRWIDGLEPLDGLVEELLVGGRVERRVKHR